MPDSNEKSEVDGEIDAHSRSELAYLPLCLYSALDTIHRFVFRRLIVPLPSLSRHVTPCSSSFPCSSLF
jgi:hypothetical protein